MNLLKAKIAERGLSMKELFKLTGIKRDTWYARVRTGMGSFRVREVRAITEVLQLSDSEIYEIFLS